MQFCRGNCELKMDRNSFRNMHSPATDLATLTFKRTAWCMHHIIGSISQLWFGGALLSQTPHRTPTPLHCPLHS